MALFQKKTPLEKEWELLLKQEEKLLKKRAEHKDSVLNQKLEKHVPWKLQDTLEEAFSKAFQVVFDKGTGIIEKTYNRSELEKQYKIRSYTQEVRQNRKSLKAFSKKAQSAGATGLLVSGVSGIGLGFLGIGMPDIVLFVGMVFRSLYEIALHYGYGYEKEEERYFILLLIQAAVSFGAAGEELDRLVDAFISSETLPEDYRRKRQIDKTAQVLSKELLYMKFLQGIPVAGVIGGAYDAIYMKRITEYAGIKYKKRFLLAKGSQG